MLLLRLEADATGGGPVGELSAGGLRSNSLAKRMSFRESLI